VAEHYELLEKITRKNDMKFIHLFLFIQILCALPRVQALLPPQLEPPLDNLMIYSGAAITMGEFSVVGGNIQVNAAATLGASTVVDGSIIAGAAVTLGASAQVSGSVAARDAGTIGADSTIGGDLTTGDAATLGANTIDGNIMVDGDLIAGAAILVGTRAVITGNLRSGAAASANLGANAIVGGNAQAGTALTFGADTVVGGSVQAGTGAVALGVNAAVADDATAGTSITLAAGATVGGDQFPLTIQQFTNEPKAPIDDQRIQLLLLQAELELMLAPVENQLIPAMTVSRILKKGVYHAAALTTTAAIEITFDGEGVEGHWLINVDSFLAFGASTKMILKDVMPGSTITWNALGYTEVGAGAELIGSFFAGSYILTGAGTKLTGIGARCGGFFANTGAVTLGASNQIGTVGCSAQPTTQIDHYQIIHDGHGLTCEAETVTINACTNVDDGTCALSTEVLILDVKATGSSLLIGSQSVIDTISFTGTGTASIPYKQSETTLLSLENTSVVAINPLVCSDGTTSSCDLVFTDAGFRFLSGSLGESTTITNQIAGTSFPLRIQAVKNNAGACEGLFSNNKEVNLSQENINPSGSGGLKFSIDGNDIAKHTEVTLIELAFGADSIAIIPTVIYHDAGEIRLHAHYDLDGISLSGNSNSFWVSPAQLAISATAGGTNLNGASATAEPSHKAGENFDLNVTAFNSLGVITPNYLPGEIQLKLARTSPKLTESVDGNLSYAATDSLTSSISSVFQSVTLATFSSGVSTYNAAHYSEVGLINLDVQDSNYGNTGIVVAATAINVGRFTPDHFTQTITEEGSLFTTCSAGTTFAYSGQTDEATGNVGAISYLTQPILTITALNKQGAITQNYYQDNQGSINDFMKLSASGIIVTAPTLDQVAIGVDSNKLPLTANMFEGTLSQQNLAKGVLHYQFSEDDNFFYNRSANALVAPFTADIDFVTATIVDTDSVNVTATVAASPAGVDIRFGRLLIANSFGPETEDFPQIMQVEHYDSAGFVVTANNNCVSYDSDNISLTNISLNPVLTPVKEASGNFSAGKAQAIELTAPGAGNQGQVGVLYGIYDWLQFDWNNDGAHDDNPSATATFGEYRGNDRIVYWREIVN
jgi:predicted acyltransferase (DUF342 family)